MPHLFLFCIRRRRHREGSDKALFIAQHVGLVTQVRFIRLLETPSSIGIVQARRAIALEDRPIHPLQPSHLPWAFLGKPFEQLTAASHFRGQQLGSVGELPVLQGLRQALQLSSPFGIALLELPYYPPATLTHQLQRVANGDVRRHLGASRHGSLIPPPSLLLQTPHRAV